MREPHHVAYSFDGSGDDGSYLGPSRRQDLVGDAGLRLKLRPALTEGRQALGERRGERILVLHTAQMPGPASGRNIVRPVTEELAPPVVDGADVRVPGVVL